MPKPVGPTSPTEERITPEVKVRPAFAPHTDSMMGLWKTWSEAVTSAIKPNALGDLGSAFAATKVSPADQYTDALLEMREIATKDPMWRSLEEGLNANPFRQLVPIDWAEIARALKTVALRSWRRPDRAAAAVAKFHLRQWQLSVDAWVDNLQRLSGGDAQVASGSDKRFVAPEWQNHPAYRTLKELYLLASGWLLDCATEDDDLTPAQRQHLTFHLRQFIDATSPTLLLISNPVAMRRAFETGGVSVTDGIRNLLSDLKEGRLNVVDTTAFAPGRNLAMSPGKVVFRNKLIELIQYETQTDSVHQIPMLILPPWINKFYILDLTQKKSMVRGLVAEGFIVFMISWRNPDASMENTSIEDYLDLGPLAASDVVREITKCETMNVMGYCIGGTLLAMTLAYLAVLKDKRFGAATFMVSLQDFAKVGDTSVFLGEPTSVDFIEQQMLERGYLDSRELSNMFSLLRSNDLIWTNVVNNYLMGQKPPAFDLLYWNSDGTRMARAAHGWYLKNTYLENNLVEPDKLSLKECRLDLGRITNDIYAVGAEKDHIVPWESAWLIKQLSGGQVRFVLASSGHIAGIINPPGGKGEYWTNEDNAETAEAWLEGSKKHSGSWWTDWFQWLAARSGERGLVPSIGSEANPPIEDAPGSYVLQS